MKENRKDPHSLGFALITLGYRDYIAARFLLNHNFIIQGVTLASTAIEKYLKAILAINGRTKKVHLDKLEELRSLLNESYYDIPNKFDKRFLNILAKAYKIRYYDNLNEPITIGFFVNQFIGELDYAISFIETQVIVNLKNQKGEVISTPYYQDIEAQEPHLFFNNYILSGITKKDHMEKIDNGYAIYVDNNNPGGELIAKGNNIRNSYNGNMTEIHFKILLD